MPAIARGAAAAVEGLGGGRHQIAHRGEQDRGVQFDRRRVRRALRRRRAQRQRQFCAPRPAGHHVHLRALSDGDLRGDVGAAAEAVQAQPPAGRQLWAQQ